MNQGTDWKPGAALLDWGCAGSPARGSLESGDAHMVAPFSGGALVMVVDGLGHGDRAAEVAHKAVAALQGRAHEPVVSLMEQCHRALVGTRGAVLSLASFDAAASTMTWLGVGNVVGRLVRVDGPCAGRPSAGSDRAQQPKTESLLLRGGIVGYSMPALHPVTLRVQPGDTLVMATDGLCSAFMGDLALDVSSQGMADRLLASYVRGSDDALVLVARYLGDQGDRK